MDSFQLSLFLHSSKGKRLDSVAQLVEQYTFNVWALGSSPSGITKLRRKSGLFCFKDLSKARFRKGTRNKKAKATHRVAFRGFGLDQFVGKSAERSGADNPKKFSTPYPMLFQYQQLNHQHALLQHLVLLKSW